MRVAVEEPVAEDHRHPGVGHPVGELAPLLRRARLEVDVRELVPWRQLQREHPSRRVAPDHLRHGNLVGVAEVPPEGLGVARLVLIIQLLPDRARELVDQRLGVDEIERPHPLAHDPRRRPHQLEVGLDLPRRLGPLHLDGDLLAVRERRAMHLADRRRRDRGLVEAEERLLDGEPELPSTTPRTSARRGRASHRPAASQLGDDVRRHHVRDGSRAAGRT